MFSLLRFFSQRKHNLIFIVCFTLVALSVSSGVIQAQASTSPSACAVTPALLGGQGFSVSGQGFSVSGQGFSVSGQGLDPLVVAAEIRDNPVTPGKWISDHFDFFDKRLGYNTDSTAIIIVDEFQQTPDGHEPHGEIVKKVVDDSLDALGKLRSGLNIKSFTVDISAAKYNADAIASAISTEVSDLQTQGYHHFVLNMSFGLISCTDPGTATTPPFNFVQATQVIAANNQTTPTLAITPLLECVVKVSSGGGHHSGDRSRVTDNQHNGGDDSSYIAYFGYKNENDQLVSIPIGYNNKLSPSPDSQSQPAQFEPGQQHFVFSAKFGSSSSNNYSSNNNNTSSSTLTWSLKGPDGQTNSITASKTSTPCATPPPSPTQPVTPKVECVADEGDGMYEAHFSYSNPNTVGMNIPVGYKNKFTPSPSDRGQVTTFIPGDHDSVFEVYFDGTDLSWTLGTITVTANASTIACPEQEGFGLSQYLTQNLGVPPDQVNAYWSRLANTVTTDEFQSLRQLLSKYLSDSADPSKQFTAVTVASSGNLRPWLGDAPLAPASWKQTIAVGASLDNSTNVWSFSQDANVVAPGVGYPLGNNSFAAGTSFASPAFSVLVGMCSTVPKALTFDGSNPPLALDSSGNKIYDNSSIGVTSLAPLLCKPASTPTITSISDQSNKEGDVVSLQVVASDLDANPLVYSAPILPPGLTINPQTGLISGTIATNSAKTYVVTVTVNNPNTPTVTAQITFNWVVTSAQTGVKIDIRPYSSSNRINLNSPGFVSVAIFGSSTFDASLIDPRTVTLAGAPAVKIFNKFYTLTFDLNHDGKIDRILWFQAKKLQLTSTSTEAVLLGKTIFDVAFRGTDKVKIVTPTAPILLSPASGSTVHDWFVKLTWRDNEDWEEGDNVCYTVQISKSAGFSNMAMGAIVVDREALTTIPLSNGTYYWRVAFSDCSINTISPWSDVWSFKVQR